MPKSAPRHFFALCLPYCLERVDGDHWIVLNRHLKPVGFDGDNYAVNHANVAHRLKLTPPILKQLGAKSRDKRIYLYPEYVDPANDGGDLADYLTNLQVLSRVQSKGTSGTGKAGTR